MDLPLYSTLLHDLFTWSYWTQQKSETARNFGLLASGFIGLFFLIWRAISNDRSARAALLQAKTSEHQMQIAIKSQTLLFKQQDNAMAQTSILARQSEISAAVFLQSVNAHYTDILHKSATMLAEKDSPFERAAAFELLSQIAFNKTDMVYRVVKMMEALLKCAYPATSKSLKIISMDFRQKSITEQARLFYSLEDAVWQAMYPHTDWHNIKFTLHELLTGTPELDQEKIKGIIDTLNILWHALPVYMQQHKILSIDCSTDVNFAISHLSLLNTEYPFVALNCSDTNFSGADFNQMNFSGGFYYCARFSGAFMYGSNLKNSKCVRAIFYGANLSGADLRDADLRYCDFRYAMLKDTLFDGADIEGADFRFGVEREKVNFSRCKSKEKAIFDDADHPVYGRFTAGD